MDQYLTRCSLYTYFRHKSHKYHHKKSLPASIVIENFFLKFELKLLNISILFGAIVFTMRPFMLMAHEFQLKVRVRANIEIVCNFLGALIAN